MRQKDAVGAGKRERSNLIHRRVLNIGALRGEAVGGAELQKNQFTNRNQCPFLPLGTTCAHTNRNQASPLSLLFLPCAFPCAYPVCPCTFSRPRPASWPHSPCSAPTVFSSRKPAAAARSCSLGAKGGKRRLRRRRVMNLSQLRRQAGSATADRTTMVRGETAIVAGIAHQTTLRLPASSPTPLPSSSHHSSVVRAAPRAHPRAPFRSSRPHCRPSLTTCTPYVPSPLLHPVSRVPAPALAATCPSPQPHWPCARTFPSSRLHLLPSPRRARRGAAPPSPSRVHPTHAVRKLPIPVVPVLHDREQRQPDDPWLRR